MPHGAPLRLGVETHPGFKMVKWLRSVEFVHNYPTIGEGMRGSREDEMFYDILAKI
jgi:sulfoxide reductase catalytic subunit YedY